jgi:hypothetical protein
LKKKNSQNRNKLRRKSMNIKCSRAMLDHREMEGGRKEDKEMKNNKILKLSMLIMCEEKDNKKYNF